MAKIILKGTIELELPEDWDMHPNQMKGGYNHDTTSEPVEYICTNSLDSEDEEIPFK